MKKIKVTYTPSLASGASVDSIPTRVIMENLLRDDRIDVQLNNSFSVFDHIARKESLDDIKCIKRRLTLPPSLESLFYKQFVITNSCIPKIQEFIDSINTEYVLYSCTALIYDLVIILEMLKKGLRVMMGGGYAICCPHGSLREIFLRLGATTKQLENLVIADGYVDLKTDLYKRIIEWKDFKITENDFSTIWDCKGNFQKPYYNIFVSKKKLDYTYMFTLMSKCFWGKCKFCYVPLFPQLSFVPNNYNPDEIAEKILETVKDKNHSIFFGDDYFYFTKKREQLLKKLKDEGIKIRVQSGIKLLLDPEYVKKASKYFHHMALGLESLSDFSLKYINKGFTKEQALMAFSNLRKYFDPTGKVISLNYIYDLPIRNKEDFYDGIDTSKSVREKMRSAGFSFDYSWRLFEISSGFADNIIDNRLVTRTNINDNNLSGRTIISRYFIEKETKNFDWNKLGLFTIPFKRFDIDGNELPPDYKLFRERYCDF